MSRCETTNSSETEGDMDLDAEDTDGVYSAEEFVADVGFPALAAIVLLILGILATLITALI